MFLIVAAVVAQAQDSLPVKYTDISISQELTVNNLYAGLLQKTIFSYDSLHSSSYTSFLIGFKATYQPYRWLAVTGIEGYGIYNAQDSLRSYETSTFCAKLTVGDVSLEFGKLSTLATELRPLPISGAAQFESWTGRTMPGGSLGAKAKYTIDDYCIGGGIAKNEGKPEYHAQISTRGWLAVGYYGESDKRFKVAASYTDGFSRSIVSYKTGQLLANYTSVRLSETDEIDVYSDIGYSLDLDKFIKLEIGAVKNFSANFFQGLIALSYVYEIRSVNGILFVYL